MNGLHDAVAVVTGGAGGIGAALCQRLAVEGSSIAVVDIRSDAVGVVADRLLGGGARARGYGVDITDREAVATAVRQVEHDLGPIDILVNNAGRNRSERFVDTDPHGWTDMIDANLVGPLNMHHAVARRMLDHGHGRIVNVSSDAGRIGAAGEAVYSACKGAIIAFSKTIARELAPAGICVNVVCPGPTDTPLFRDVAGDGEQAAQFSARLTAATPLGRLAQPIDIVGAICFLASTDAAFITGQVISVSGGLTMVG